MTYPQTLGVVLAGGLARRMGGGDKARIRVGGLTILERVVQRLRPQCAGLVLNANAGPERFADAGLSVVADSVPELSGPTRRHFGRSRLGRDAWAGDRMGRERAERLPIPAARSGRAFA